MTTINERREAVSTRGQGPRWAILLLVAGYLLFSHLGCHGDEDNELFARLAHGVQAVGQGR